MQTSFHPESLARFYTDKKISELLVGLLRSIKANRIVDLGSGSGSLAAAARRRWRHAEIVTVDIDSSGTSRARESLRPLGLRHRHIRADALDLSLPNRLVSQGRLFDVAVCNPPYLSPSWRKGFEHILEQAGLLPAYPVMSNAGADILFIAQNLRLVRDGGQLGLIVPDGVIAGRRMDSHKLILEKPLKTSVQDLQDMAEVLRTFAKTINNYLFENVLERSVRNRDDQGRRFYEADWTWQLRKDRPRFKRYYDLFRSTLDAIPSLPLNEVYKSFRAECRPRRARKVPKKQKKK